MLPDNGVVEDYRTKVKGLELEAERLEHEALLDFFQDRAPGTGTSSPIDAARENLAAYESCLATSFPKESIQTILAAFEAKHGRNAA